MRQWSSTSVAATRAIGAELAVELLPDGALLLVGERGAGKTVLVQGLAAGLGIDPEEVPSDDDPGGPYSPRRAHRHATGS